MLDAAGAGVVATQLGERQGACAGDNEDGDNDC